MSIRILAAALILAIACMMPAAQAQEKKGDKAAQPQMSAEEQEMMKKWQEAMTPGAMHKKLGEMTGTWNCVIKSWMRGEGEPMVSKGTSTMKMIMGGRYQQQDVSSEMMGMPMKGMGLLAYDNMKKKFIGTWIDNMGTGISTMEGTLNDAGDVLTMNGTMDDPTTGEFGKPVKYVTRLVGKDKQVFEMYDLSLSEPHTKVMELVYTRKK